MKNIEIVENNPGVINNLQCMQILGMNAVEMEFFISREKTGHF